MSPIGRPARVNPHGTLQAGSPVRFATQVSRAPTSSTDTRRPRDRRLELSDRSSGQRGGRGDQDVDLLEHLAQGSPDERPHSLALQVA
jgi:hypothetical protein